MMPYSMKFAKKKKKKKANIKIKFHKMRGTFLDSTPSLKSHQPPLIRMLFITREVTAETS